MIFLGKMVGDNKKRDKKKGSKQRVFFEFSEKNSEMTRKTPRKNAEKVCKNAFFRSTKPDKS